jgi:tetratricopeptide (TPR) repeat protein
MDPTYYKALIRRGTAYTYTGQYGKAIDDFTCAMNLCPLGERGSLSKLLDKARSKFLDSEGIEHSSTADRAPPIPPVISAIDLDMAKEIEESIPIVRISSLDEVVDTRRYKFLQMGICETSYTAETFTRIAISDDDDDDDDEQEVVEECNNTTMGQFTRVTISEDDDDEEEEADVDDTEGEWAALVAEGDTASVDIYGSLQETVSSLQDAGHHDEAVSFIRESQQGISSLTQGQRTDLLQALTISLSALARYNEVITICTEALEADSSLAWAYLGRAHAYKLTVS